MPINPFQPVMQMCRLYDYLSLAVEILDILFWFTSPAMYYRSSLGYIFFLGHHSSTKACHPSSPLLSAAVQLDLVPWCESDLCLSHHPSPQTLCSLGLSLKFWLLRISYLNGLLPDLCILTLLIKIGGSHVNILFSFNPHQALCNAFVVFLILQTGIRCI